MSDLRERLIELLRGVERGEAAGDSEDGETDRAFVERASELRWRLERGEAL